MRATPEVLERIGRHGSRTYPEECCGFLVGSADSLGNRVTGTIEVDNQRDENRERRYLIGPRDYLEADRQARSSGRDIVGVYHSHPDHPARPSATDLAEATFPGFTYVIVSVSESGPGDLTAWSLAPDRGSFQPEEIRREP